MQPSQTNREAFGFRQISSSLEDPQYLVAETMEPRSAIPHCSHSIPMCANLPLSNRDWNLSASPHQHQPHYYSAIDGHRSQENPLYDVPNEYDSIDQLRYADMSLIGARGNEAVIGETVELTDTYVQPDPNPYSLRLSMAECGDTMSNSPTTYRNSSLDGSDPLLSSSCDGCPQPLTATFPVSQEEGLPDQHLLSNNGNSTQSHHETSDSH